MTLPADPQRRRKVAKAVHSLMALTPQQRRQVLTQERERRGLPPRQQPKA